MTRLRWIVVAALLAAVCPWADAKTKKNIPAKAKTEAPLEVVIHGADKDLPSVAKPLWDIPVDAYETIRTSLLPDDAMIFAESPSATSGGGDRVVALRNTHLLQPWNDTLFEKNILDDGVMLNIRLESWFEDFKFRPDVKDGAWALSIIDEDGQLFQSFAGDGGAPENVTWNGKSDSGRWFAAGHDYSSVLRLTDPSGQIHNIMGHIVRSAVLTHAEPKARVVSLDSSILFGPKRDQPELSEAGRNFLRAAADFIRRRAYDSPVRISLIGGDGDLAAKQAREVYDYLADELFLAPPRISVSNAAGPSSETRLDLSLSR
jgi:hypothetical protein